MERLIDNLKTEKDEPQVEVSLRPKEFKDFPGQEVVKEKLQVFIQSSVIREESLDHVLLSCLLYTSPSPRDATLSRMPSSA